MIVLAIDAFGSLEAAEALERAAAVLEPARLQSTIGLAAVDVTQRHLAQLGATRPNKLGAPSTGFYKAASESVHWRAEGETVTVAISHVGIAQRYYGGTITAKNAQYLTIPAIAEAHGKRAREFPDLDFAVLDGRAALVRRAQTRIGFRADRRKGRAGLKRAYAIAETPEQAVFWLKRSVTQRPDPSVLPSEDTLLDTITTRVDSAVDRARASS